MTMEDYLMSEEWFENGKMELFQPQVMLRVKSTVAQSYSSPIFLIPFLMVSLWSHTIGFLKLNQTWESHVLKKKMTEPGICHEGVIDEQKQCDHSRLRNILKGKL